MSKTTVTVGSLWGDEGKGKIATYIVVRDRYDVVVRAGTGTNAGHSLYDEGNYIHTHQLPLAGVYASMKGMDVKIAVGSGVCFDPKQYQREITEYGIEPSNVVIDHRAPVICQKHKDKEFTGSNYGEGKTGSTKTGTGEARVDAVRRVGDRVGKWATYNRHDRLEERIVVGDVAKLLNRTYDEGGQIMVEGSQAHYLSLYLSPDYPVVTSDNCTASAFIDDVGLSWNRVDEVCVVIKSAPTRVSQKCGALPGEISVNDMKKRGIVEKGVTTGRVRRKTLEIPFDLLEDVVMINQPTYFALTFCDHVDDYHNVKLPGKVSKGELRDFRKTYSNIIELESRFGVPVKYIEYGKDFSCVAEVV